MTVTTNTNKVQALGNGVNKTFPYSFRIYSASDLEVTRTDLDAGTDTVLALNTDYTVTGAGSYNGGNVVLTGAAPSASTRITIRRVIAVTQGTDLRNQGAYFAETHEDVFDRLTMIDQQQQESIDRSLTLPASSSGVSTQLPSPVGGQVVGWNADGTALKNYGPVDNTLLAVDLADEVTPGKGVAMVGNALDKRDLADSADMAKGTALVGGAGRVVNSIATLRTLPKTGSKSACVTGYYTAGDGGGGSYYYDSADTTSADNGGSVIVATDGGRWKLVIGDQVSLRQFGAKGDNTADDAPAIGAFISYLLATGKTGFVPKGNYRHVGRLLVDMSGSNTRSAPRIYGDGPYQSKILVESTVANAVHFYSTGVGGFDHFFLKLEGIGFEGNNPSTFACIGLDDFSDAPGNYSLKDVYFGNSNTTNSTAACTLKLNFVFRSTFDNVIAVGKVGYGVASIIRRAVYCTFTGFIPSNANIGILFEGIQPVISNDFIGVDIENCNYGVRNENAAIFGNQFIGGFFDLYNPDTSTVSTQHAFSSTGGQLGAINILGSPFVSRGGYLSPTEQAGITLRGNIGPTVSYFSPALPATGVGVRNTSGQFQSVMIWDGTVTSISANNMGDTGRNAFMFPISGITTIVLPPGAEIIVNYSAAPSWFWAPAA